MVVFDKQKYACLSCIRGHRSSSCEHRDRILLQVRKPGRKSLSEPRSRFALVRKEQSPSAGGHCCNNPGKMSEFKLVRVPSIARPDVDLPRTRPKQFQNGTAGSTEREDDDVVLTDKFVFVHVGDNLYRRELRPDTLPTRLSPSAESQAPTPIPEHSDEQRDVKCAHSMSLTPSTLHLGQPSAHSRGPIDIPMQTPIDPQISTIQPRMDGIIEPHMNYRSLQSAGPHRDSVHVDPDARDADAPLVIAPMSVHNSARHSNNNSDILHELGLTTEEAEQLWPGAFDSGADLSYAPQCVMPGQCECGDGCACPDCYEHKLKYESLQS